MPRYKLLKSPIIDKRCHTDWKYAVVLPTLLIFYIIIFQIQPVSISNLGYPSIINNPTDYVLNLTKCPLNGNMSIFIYNYDKSINYELELVHQSYSLAKSPEEACLVIYISSYLPVLNPYHNNLIINLGARMATSAAAVLVQNSPGRPEDILIELDQPTYHKDSWKGYPEILPAWRPTFAIAIHVQPELFRNFTVKAVHDDEPLTSSTFCILRSSENFLKTLNRSLKDGCIPVLLGKILELPLQEFLDWDQFTIVLSEARIGDSERILRSYGASEIVEMRRLGRQFHQSYFGDVRAVVKTILAVMRYRLRIPIHQEPCPIDSIPGFEYLSDGNFSQKPIISQKYKHKFAEFSTYSKYIWNNLRAPWRSFEYLPLTANLPVDGHFDQEVRGDYDPILKPHGAGFRAHLGGNNPLEQFTVLLLSYNRDQSLNATLKNLNELPFLQKVIVMWNGITRKLPKDWVKIHVPILFVNPGANSMNNRYFPLDLIETEAVVMLDDDVIITADAFSLGFRVWRENRDRLVGFMMRRQKGHGNQTRYLGEGACQYSMVIPDSAFLHKDYMRWYTNELPEVMRETVVNTTNCDDLAMNYLVASATQKPPLKVTKYQKEPCKFNCNKGLSNRPSHYKDRTDCMLYFNRVLGYNPLRYTQYRADSVSYNDGWSKASECFPDV